MRSIIRRSNFHVVQEHLQMKSGDSLVYYGAVLLCLHHVLLIGSCLPSNHHDIIDAKVLNAGEELCQEELPFQMGHRLYRLHGLKASMWYEVKISYPASIPASFSIQLKQDKSDLELNMGRRLLNTEKLIFMADSDLRSGYSEMYVLVTVEPAGFVAKPLVPERESVMFNIVCDELSLGIPHKAWWVGVLAFLCLGVALVIPYFLPSHLYRRIQGDSEPGISKAS